MVGGGDQLYQDGFFTVRAASSQETLQGTFFHLRKAIFICTSTPTVAREKEEFGVES